MAAIEQLDTENADLDLTSMVTVLTDTPDASNPRLCIGYIALGDGVKDLDGTGGTFELVVTVGGQTVQPSPQEVSFGTEVRSGVWTAPFPVPANTEVILRVQSPNAADTDVDVTAYLYDFNPNSTNQSGDAYAQIGIAGAGLTALGDARLANLDATVTSRSTFNHAANQVVVATNNDKTAYELTAAERTAISAANGARVVDVLTVDQALRRILAVVAGAFTLTGAAYAFKRQNGTTTEITETIASTGRTPS